MTVYEVISSLDLQGFDCHYCDVRVEERFTTDIHYRNRELENFSTVPSMGAFIRVYNNGAWYYCATTELQNIPQTIKELVAESLKHPGANKNLFSHMQPKSYNFVSDGSNDPRKIPLSNKKALCESYFECFDGIKEIKEERLMYTDHYLLKGFKNSKDIEYFSDCIDYGFTAPFLIQNGDKVFRDRPDYYSPTFAGLKNKQEEISRFVKESLQWLTAEKVEPGKYPVVMNSETVGVFAHESFGHKSEADFMLGDENATKDWKIGSKVGTDVLTIIDEGGIKSTSGWCPIDDEGTPASKTYLIKNGILQGRLHNLETATEMDESPTGNGRAISFEFEPIVRMTNTYLEPGQDSFENLLKKAGNGIFIDSHMHGSGLSTFTIAPRRAYRIKDGKLAEPVLVAVISGSVFDTLGKISACSKNDALHSFAFGGCGKGEQWPLPVGYGGPSILVDEMQVG